jgi:CubicO group peptidase (beta-lactamase class C family)
MVGARAARTTIPRLEATPISNESKLVEGAERLETRDMSAPRPAPHELASAELRAAQWRGLLSLITLVLAMPCSACVYSRIFYYNIPSLSAANYFDHRAVEASSTPLPFARLRDQIAFPMRQSRSASYPTFEELVSKNDTRALLVLHHDVLVYERYWGGVTAETRLPCFSMSKTFAAVLIGCAQQDGLFASVQQRLVDFVPALSSRPGYSDITLDHLLRMTSGIDFEEESVAGAVLYYTTDLRSWTHTFDVTSPPGQHYQYGSINVQLLWEALQPRLAQRTVANYFQERLWKALGAERPATWDLDSLESGVEKLSGGLSATAGDFARLGVLFQHHGRFHDQQVISEQWVNATLAEDPVAGIVHTTDGAVRRGRYQWFWTMDGRCYFAKGYNGQYIFVDKERDVVVTRFGEGYGDVDWTALFEGMAETAASL